MQMIFPDGADGHALGEKSEDLLPQPISDLIRKTLSSKKPMDLAGFTHKDASSLTIKCVPFEGEQGIKGVILTAF